MGPTLIYRTGQLGDTLVAVPAIRAIKAAAPDYPIKFALFDSGSHGTPIRMTDWRLILNWMLAVDKK